jgi:hypothetical protein
LLKLRLAIAGGRFAFNWSNPFCGRRDQVKI